MAPVLLNCPLRRHEPIKQTNIGNIIKYSINASLRIQQMWQRVHQMQIVITTRIEIHDSVIIVHVVLLG